MITRDSKIYVAGQRGLVGSAIWSCLKAKGYNNLIGRTHAELDLTDQAAVNSFFDEEKPDAVVLAAGMVGGIMANSLYRADFLHVNLQIQCNVFRNAFTHHVKKLLFVSSTCVYPKIAPQPMNESELLTSTLEYSNEEYALAMIAGLRACESYNLQYGTNFVAVVPTNLYGPNDNFHLENSHVMPAMMRKIYLAKLIADDNWGAIREDMNRRPITPPAKLRELIGEKKVSGEDSKEHILKALDFFGIDNNKVTLWGTGRQYREFLWSEDMADACVHVLMSVDFSDIIGIKEYSSVFYGATTDGPVDRNATEGRGGAIPSLGEIRNCQINVGTGNDVTLRDLAGLIAKTAGFTGKIVFDKTKPDGYPRRMVDDTRIHKHGWQHKVDVEDGVAKLFTWYKSTLKINNE